MNLLENKVALITGAGRGIGKAIALRFAQEGCNIAFTDIALNDVVMETEKELAALGVKVKAYASNAANFEETHQVVDEIVKDFGRIDILVNNAGITKDTARLTPPMPPTSRRRTRSSTKSSRTSDVSISSSTMPVSPKTLR